ncbi:MAG: dGTPase [Lachnospiraceae bacterium]|nr:dGTPase [Lachnospiraceae bacterium]
MEMGTKYNQLLSVDRMRPSSMERKSTIDHFYSDRLRILYSSSFRRLQQKAQVFSLEPNASVRTRLTHSLEVSDLGRTLANRIAYRLSENKLLDFDKIPDVVAIVENACLLHDIGNPPFGHFGEIAIRDWANNSALNALPKGISKEDSLLKVLMSDFLEFDGNPQGFRTITKLHTEYDEFSFNLTFATLLCTLKYSRAAGEEKGPGIMKKAGYFRSEEEVVKKICSVTGTELHHRYPLTYIMEAADDIAYCMSDIADGIEKRILTGEMFINEFKKEWQSKYKIGDLPVDLPDADNIQFGKSISVPWSQKAMTETVDNFFEHEEEVFEGTADSLINISKPMGRVLETIKSVSRKILYPSFEAESIELTGYAVITGILKNYERVLSLPYETFLKMVNNDKTDNTDVERRLYNRLGRRYISAYKYAVSKLDVQQHDYAIKEWWLRVHLLVDHVSGMTDEFALETYQMLEGINLMHK